MNLNYLKYVAALLAILPLSVIAGQAIDEHWDIDANAVVAVENVAGKIEIQGWEKNEAHLTGMLGNSVDELEVDASRSRLEIKVVNRNEMSIDNTDLKLMVPFGVNINVSAVSADIGVSGLDNEKLKVFSVSGDLDISASSRRVSLESVSGSVDFSGYTARISAESVSGDLSLSGVSGEIAASTVSGDMVLVAENVERGKLETVSGDAEVECELSDNGSLKAESMSGDVILSLSGGYAGLLEANSFSGEITSAFGTVEEEKYGPGSRLRYESGNGSAEVRVESFSGDIKLKRK